MQLLSGCVFVFLEVNVSYHLVSLLYMYMYMCMQFNGILLTHHYIGTTTSENLWGRYNNTGM